MLWIKGSNPRLAGSCARSQSLIAPKGGAPEVGSLFRTSTPADGSSVGREVNDTNSDGRA